MGCLNPNLGKIWTNPNVGLKCKVISNFNPTLTFTSNGTIFGNTLEYGSFVNE